MMFAMSRKSDEVCRRIIKAGLHSDMLKNLTWKTLTTAVLDNEPSHPDNPHPKRTVVGLQISILNNVLRRAEYARGPLRRSQAVQVVHKFRGLKVYKVVILFVLPSIITTKEKAKKVTNLLQYNTIQYNTIIGFIERYLRSVQEPVAVLGWGQGGTGPPKSCPGPPNF